MLEGLAAARDGEPVWIDSLEYCQARILHDGALPWDNPAEIGDFFAKADSLFSSDAVLLDVGRAYSDLVGADVGIRTEMGARNRPGYALKVMLGDASLRSLLLDAAVAVAALASSRKRSLVISLPSPPRWLREAQRLRTWGSEVKGLVDQKELEAAAIYTADHLRALATLPIDAIVIDEGGRRDEAVNSLEAYRPILNVAKHFGWPVLHRADLDHCWSCAAVGGVVASLGCCAPAVPQAQPWGVVSELGASVAVYATGGSPAVLVVPKDGDPDDMRSQMASLRQR